MPEDATGPFALGLDLGTSALKAVLVDAHARVLGAAGAPIATLGTLPGQAEQDASQWLTAAGQAVAALDACLARGPRWRGQVGAIGLTGQLPTLVVLGERGPIGPAISWQDSRADAATAALVGARRGELYRITGMPIDGRYLAPMFRFHWHERRTEIRRLLSAKDYLCAALTGAEVTDPSTAAGYGLFELASGGFSSALCALWDVPQAVLPEIRPAHSVAGPLSPAGAALLGLATGVPVSVGAADSMSGAYAMGSLGSTGRACVAMGSSTVILGAVRELQLDPRMRYLLSPHVESGWYAREMDLLATGTGHAWLSGLLGWAPGALEQRAAHSPIGARGVTFTPYLAGGEQGALWNPALRGALHGLTLQARDHDLARAFMEGVGFEIRRCIEVLHEAHSVTEIVLAGHLARDPFAAQMLANILRRPVQPFPSVSPAALGAALGALRALHAPNDPPPATAWPSRFAPDTDQHEYQQCYANYLKVSAACAS